jgi:hypothetical protein
MSCIPATQKSTRELCVERGSMSLMADNDTNLLSLLLKMATTLQR